MSDPPQQQQQVLTPDLRRSRPQTLQASNLVENTDNNNSCSLSEPLPMPVFARTPTVGDQQQQQTERQERAAAMFARSAPLQQQQQEEQHETSCGLDFMVLERAASSASLMQGSRTLTSSGIGGNRDSGLRVPSTPGGRSVSPMPNRPAQRSTIGGFSSTGLRSVVSSPSLSRNKSNVTFDSTTDLTGMTPSASSAALRSPGGAGTGARVANLSSSLYANNSVAGASAVVSPDSVAALALGDLLEDPATTIVPPRVLTPSSAPPQRASSLSQQEFLNALHQQQQQERGASSATGDAKIVSPTRVAGAARGDTSHDANDSSSRRASNTDASDDEGCSPPPARGGKKSPEERMTSAAATAVRDQVESETAPPSPSSTMRSAEEPKPPFFGGTTKKDEEPLLAGKNNDNNSNTKDNENDELTPLLGRTPTRLGAKSATPPGIPPASFQPLPRPMLHTPDLQRQQDGGEQIDADDVEDDFVESELMLIRLYVDNSNITNAADTASIAHTDTNTMSPAMGSPNRSPSNDAFDEQTNNNVNNNNNNHSLIMNCSTSYDAANLVMSGSGVQQPSRPLLLVPAAPTQRLRRGSWIGQAGNISSTTHPLQMMQQQQQQQQQQLASSSSPDHQQPSQTDDSGGDAPSQSAVSGKGAGSGPASPRGNSNTTTTLDESATAAVAAAAATMAAPRYVVVDMDAEYHRYARKRQFDGSRGVSGRQGSVQLSQLSTPAVSFGARSAGGGGGGGQPGSGAGSGYNMQGSNSLSFAGPNMHDSGGVLSSSSQNDKLSNANNSNNPFQGFDGVLADGEKLLGQCHESEYGESDTEGDSSTAASSRHGSRRLKHSATQQQATSELPPAQEMTSSFRNRMNSNDEEGEQSASKSSSMRRVRVSDVVEEKRHESFEIKDGPPGDAADASGNSSSNTSSSNNNNKHDRNSPQQQQQQHGGSGGSSRGQQQKQYSQTPMMLCHSFRTKHLSGVPEQADPDDDGGCGCSELQISRFETLHEVDALDFGQLLSRCSICQRRPAAFISLHDLQACCPSHVEALAQQCPQNHTLFVNTLDISTAYDRIFWCERCKSFTWKFTDGYGPFIDRIVRTRKPYLAEPSTDVLVQHYQIRDRGAAATWKPVVAAPAAAVVPTPPPSSSGHHPAPAANSLLLGAVSAGASLARTKSPDPAHGKEKVFPGQPLQRLCITMTSTQGWRSTQEDAEVVFRVTTKSLQLPDSVCLCAPATEYVVLAVFDGHGGDAVAKIAAHNIEHHFRFALHNEIIGLRHAKQNEMARNESMHSVGTLESPARDAAMRAQSDVSTFSAVSTPQQGIPGTDSFPVTPSLGAATVTPTAGGGGGGGVAAAGDTLFQSNGLPILTGESKQRHSFFEKVLVETLLSLDRAIQNTPEHMNDYLYGMVGATACVVVITEEDIVCASAGDSRAVLWNKKRRMTIPLSEDHKLSVPSERARVEDAGYSIVNDRIEGFLAVPRALGDFDFKMNGSVSQCEQAVTARPDVRLIPRSYLRAQQGQKSGSSSSNTGTSSTTLLGSNQLFNNYTTDAPLIPGPHTVVNEQYHQQQKEAGEDQAATAAAASPAAGQFYTMAAQPPEDWMVLCACDGVWDVLSNEEACVLADKVFDEEVHMAYVAHRRRVSELSKNQHSSFNSMVSQFSAFDRSNITNKDGCNEAGAFSALPAGQALSSPVSAAGARATTTPPPPPIKSVAGSGISALRSLANNPATGASSSSAVATGTAAASAKDNSAPLISGIISTDNNNNNNNNNNHHGPSNNIHNNFNTENSVFPSCWYTAALHSNAINDALGDAVCGILRAAIATELDEDAGKGGDNCSCIACKLCTTA